MSSNLIKEAYYEGFEARRVFEEEGGSNMVNPYEVHSARWHSWEKGWNDYFTGF